MNTTNKGNAVALVNQLGLTPLVILDYSDIERLSQTAIRNHLSKVKEDVLGEVLMPVDIEGSVSRDACKLYGKQRAMAALEAAAELCNRFNPAKEIQTLIEAIRHET